MGLEEAEELPGASVSTASLKIRPGLNLFYPVVLQCIQSQLPRYCERTKVDAVNGNVGWEGFSAISSSGGPGIRQHVRDPLFQIILIN